MKKYLFLALLAISNLLLAQDSKISAGIEMGLIKNWSTMPIDEVGLFINSQDYTYTVHELFRSAYISYEKQYGLRLDFFKATYSDLICAKGNTEFGPNVRDCGGSDWNAYQINLNVYKKIYLFNKKRIYLKPSVGLGIMWYGGDSYSLGNSGKGATGGSLFKYYYEDCDTNLRNKNLTINSSAAIGYQINPRLSLILHYNYQQGLLKMYQIDVIAWKRPSDPEIYDRPTDPSLLKKVQINSYGSNSHFGLGLEYCLKSATLHSISAKHQEN
jgi:hypothetical protein